MITTTFDTLQFAKKLREAGISEKAAEIHAEALKEIIDNNLATKQDIENIRRDLTEWAYKLTIRMGVMCVAVITILAAIIKF
jgi:hypothetical protein